MARADKIFSKKLDREYNPLIYVLFVIFLIGVFFLAMNEVDAGYIYALIILGSIISIVFASFVFKGDTDLETIGEYIKYPFSQKLTLSVFFGIVGFVTPIFLTFFSSILRSSFQITSLSIPLFSNEINSVFQSFSTVEFLENASWRYFITSFSAGVGETIVFSWAIVIMSMLFMFGIYRLLSDETGNFIIPKTWFVKFGGIILSGFIFIGAHLLNGTYQGNMFWVAFFFLLISNFLIYYVGIFLMFFVFYHISNNLLYLIQVDGFDFFVKNALFGWFGFILVTIFLLMFYYLLNNWNKTVNDLRWYFSK